jgi:rhodanese-related sulfurtransferase
MGVERLTNAIDINDLTGLLAHGDRLSILDVRRKTDYEATAKKVPGAEWHDPEKIDEWLEQLPAGNRTVVYCVKGGSVSQSVADRLRNEGIDAVFLEGGLKKWMESGQPVEATVTSRNA